MHSLFDGEAWTPSRSVSRKWRFVPNANLLSRVATKGQQYLLSAAIWGPGSSQQLLVRGSSELWSDTLLTNVAGPLYMDAATFSGGFALVLNGFQANGERGVFFQRAADSAYGHASLIDTSLAFYTRIAAHDSLFHVVWVGTRGTNQPNGIWASVSLNQGRRWSRPVRVDTASHSPELAIASVSGATIIAAANVSSPSMELFSLHGEKLRDLTRLPQSDAPILANASGSDSTLALLWATASLKGNGPTPVLHGTTWRVRCPPSPANDE